MRARQRTEPRHPRASERPSPSQDLLSTSEDEDQYFDAGWNGLPRSKLAKRQGRGRSGQLDAPGKWQLREQGSGKRAVKDRARAEGIEDIRRERRTPDDLLTVPADRAFIAERDDDRA